MTTYRPHERINIDIQDATVLAVNVAWGGTLDDPESIDVTFGSEDRSEATRVRIPLPAQPGVTITRVAPNAQADDVWRLPDGMRWHIVKGVVSVGLQAVPADGSPRLDISRLDFTGAELLFRLAPDPATVDAPAMLRRFEDAGLLKRGVWTETDVESGLYLTPFLSGIGASPVDRDRAARVVGPLTDLPPVASPGVNTGGEVR